MVYQAIDVARFIVNYCDDNGYIVSQFKLQIFMYFVQSWYLSEFAIPCFNDDIEAVSWGVKIPSVYEAFIKFGGNCIPRIKKYEMNNPWGIDLVEWSPDIITKEDKNEIMQLVDELQKYSFCTLLDTIHKQESWKKAYQNLRWKVKCNSDGDFVRVRDCTISKQSLENVFK